MSTNRRSLTRRRFAAALGCALGVALIRPSHALASLERPRFKPGGPLAPIIVNRPVVIHGNADLGDVVMRRGALVLRDGGVIDIQRLDSRS